MVKIKSKRFVFLSILIIIVLIILGILAYLVILPRTVINDELSDRAVEFISENNSSIRNVDLTPQVKNDNSTIIVKDCYSFVFPFDLKDAREQEECSNIYNFKDPIGKVVIRLKNFSQSNLSDLPDVRLREEKSDIYKKSLSEINGVEYYIFKKSDGGYEQSAFAIYGPEVLSVSLTSQIDDEFDTKFVSLLESIIIE